MFDYAARQGLLSERLEQEGIDALFLAPSADLEYLTGVERQLPIFGEVNYAHGWVTGALFRPRREPVFLFPRMFAAFDLREEPQGEVIVVSETDDGAAIFERVAKQVDGTGGVAVGDRVWAETALHLGRALGFDRLRTGTRIVNELRRTKDPDELAAMGRAIDTVEQAMAAVAPLVVPGVTMLELAEAVEHELLAAGSRTPSFPTHIFTGLDADSFDSHTETGRNPIPEGTSVMFDFGGVVDGYCSDFGRTVYCGDPPQDFLDGYATMLAAYEAGKAAARTGARARGGERRLPRADRRGGARRALPPPHGPRDRQGRPREAVPLDRGRDPARAGHDLHRRAVADRPGPLEPPDREHHRRRGRRRPEPQLVSRRPDRQLVACCSSGPPRRSVAAGRPAAPEEGLAYFGATFVTSTE